MEGIALVFSLSYALYSQQMQLVRVINWNGFSGMHHRGGGASLSINQPMHTL